MKANQHLTGHKSPSELNFYEPVNTIFEDVFVFYGILDPNGYVLDLRGKIFEKTNHNPALLIGQKFSETVFWQSSEHTAKTLEKVIEESSRGKKVKVLLDFRLSSDEKLFIEFNLHPHANNRNEIFFSAYDVTERENQIEFYRQQSEHLLYAAESAEIGLWSWDLNDNTVYCTPRCNELLEVSEDDLMTYDSFVRILHPEDRQQVEEILMQSQNNGTEYDEQFRVIYSDATIDWISARGKTFLDQAGNPLKMMGVLSKITERKLAEEDLSRVYDREKKARDEAEEANRSKDFFLAFVSHELRSPLNAILGWSKILLSKKVDDETHKNALETIERSARSQAKLINDLVDSARIASGRLRLELHQLNLCEILKTVYHSQKPAADSKNISLQFSPSDKEIPVFGDTNRLQQVFNNLISNSLKFTPEGGIVLIDARTLSGVATVTIKDNGQGISSDALPNIFRQFSQGDENIAQDKGGLGLGLSIVKILVEKHNGTVRAESEGIDQGASFVVTLPLTEVNQDEAAETEQWEKIADEQDKPLHGIKILLVEDDDDSREVLELFLRQCGAKVESAESAETAMSLLSGAKGDLPNVIVSDLAMPEEDGYSLISRIRRLPSQVGGHVPAIALSAFATKENKQKAFASGFQKYTTKPFEPDLLINEILGLVKK